MVISSLENEKVKELVKLQRKKYRDLTKTYVIEGKHLVEEAYKEGIILEIFLIEGEEIVYKDIKTTFITLNVMKKISTLDNPCNMIALCKMNDSTRIIGNKILLLDEVQSPGNLGTIIRSALAFNISTIILSNNTVDLYNPKVLRATQGNYCHINIINMDIYKALSILKEKKYIVYGTDVVDGEDIRLLKGNDKNKFCLIMGNEGRGVNSDIKSMCDKNLYIPMNSKIESLNVGVACSILLYELGR